MEGLDNQTSFHLSQQNTQNSSSNPVLSPSLVGVFSSKYENNNNNNNNNHLFLRCPFTFDHFILVERKLLIYFNFDVALPSSNCRDVDRFLQDSLFKTETRVLFFWCNSMSYPLV